MATPNKWHHPGPAPAAGILSAEVGFPLDSGEGAYPARRNPAAGAKFLAGRVGGRKRKCWLVVSVSRPAAAGSAMEHVTEGSWESLPVSLHPRVLGALRELGFLYMTPVQVPGVARGGASSVRSWQRGTGGLRAGQALAEWDTAGRC